MNDLINDALEGRRGNDQRLIAEACMMMTGMLLQKNADYGGSIFNPPILDPTLSAESQVRVRMSDKIQRLQHLYGVVSSEVQESTDDTIMDLAGYAILLLVVRQKDQASRIGGVDRCWENAANALDSMIGRKDEWVVKR